jgi:Glycosyl transferase family 2/Bacterial membrane protein YfhO
VSTTKTDTTDVAEGRASRFFGSLKRNRGPLLLMLVAVIFFFQTLILTRSYYFGDVVVYYYPARVFMSATLKSGHMPFMSPNLFSGYPLFADSETGLFYPLNFLSFFLPNLAAFNYSLFLHFLATSIFTYLYARTIKLSRTAAVFAGLAFAFGGFSLAHLGHVNIVNTLAWFPLILYLVEKGMRKDSYAWFLWAGLALGMQFLAGFLMLPLFTVSVAFFYVMLYPRQDRWTAHGFLRAAGMFAVFLVIGLGIGAIQNVPSYELVKISNRASASTQFFYKYNFPPQQVLSFAFPRYFGGFGARYWGAWDFTEAFGYVGLLPLALAPAALFRRTSWYTRFFTTAGLVALVISFGRVGRLYTLVHWIPGYSVLKDPGRFLMIVDFALVMLAAIGLDRVLDRRAFTDRAMRRWVWLVTAGAGVVVGGVILAKVLTRYKVLNLETFKNFSVRTSVFYVPVIMMAVLLALLWLWRRGFFTRNFFAAALIAFALFELFFTGAAMNLQVPSSHATETPPPIASIQKDRGIYRVTLERDPSYKGKVYNYEANQLMTYGLEDPRGYSSIEPQRYGRLIELANEHFQLPVFDLLNVRYFIANLTPVGERVFDINRPVYFEPASPPSTWEVGGFVADRIETLSTVAGGQLLQEGTQVAYLSVSTDAGTLGPYPITVGGQTGQAGKEAFKSGGSQARTGAVPVAYGGFDGSSRTGYVGTVPLGGTVKIQNITVTPAPGLSQPGQLFTLTGMNVAGSVSQPAEIGPVTYMDPGTLVYRNPGELPRAFTVGGAALERGYREAIRTLYRYDPSRTIALEADSLPPGLRAKVSRWGTDRRVDGSASVVKRTARSETVEAQATADCMLLWSASFMPGWTATLDGKPATIYPAFGGLSSVYLPGGKHRVVFTYSPPGLPTGAFLTLLALILAIGGLALARRRGRTPGAGPAEPVLQAATGGPTAPPATVTDPAAGGISAFFPACNDEATIEALVRTAVSVLERNTGDFEVIVIDDGSTDNTGEIADRLAASDRRVRVVHHERPRGYGGALRAGFEAARKGLIFYTDGDGQYDAGELGLLLERRFDADVINGYKLKRGDPLYRRLIGRAYSSTARLLFGIRIRDVDCDFRLIRSEALEGMRLESQSGTICLELVKKIQDRGFTFSEVPVHHFERASGRSQFFRPRSLIGTSREFTTQLWQLEIKKSLLGERLR